MTGTLKARVGGAWVPILGSGQEAANTARWNSAWGIATMVAVATVTPAASVETLVATISSFTPITGRRYKLVFHARATRITSQVSINFKRNGVQFAQQYLATQPAWGYADVTTIWDSDGVAGSFTVYANPTTTFEIAGTESWFYIEDLGPITLASIAPPTAGPRVVASGNALGIVAMGSFVGPSATIPINTFGNVTNALPVTLAVGRRYRVRFAVRAVGTTAGSLSLRLSDYSTVISDLTYAETYFGGPYPNLQWEWLINGDDALHSYSVQLRPQNGSATAYLEALGLFYVEDVGPNTSPALPIPETPPAWIPLPLGSYTCPNAGIPAYRKIGDVVYLRGNITGGVNGGYGTTLPVGFRPPATVELAVFAYNAGWTYVTLTIGNDGQIMYITPAGAPTNPGNISLHNIQFSVTP